MESLEYIRRAKQLLFDITPLHADCGRLCGSICCKGDENTGMELLPGEYENEMRAFGTRKDNIFVCGGSCDRRNRPYACMIFPLFPAVRYENGQLSVRVIRDIRSFGICPLVARGKMNHEFETAVRRSARVLCESEELRDYLIEKTNELEELMHFNWLMRG